MTLVYVSVHHEPIPSTPVTHSCSADATVPDETDEDGCARRLKRRFFNASLAKAASCPSGELLDSILPMNMSNARPRVVW